MDQKTHGVGEPFQGFDGNLAAVVAGQKKADDFRNIMVKK